MKMPRFINAELKSDSDSEANERKMTQWSENDTVN